MHRWLFLLLLPCCIRLSAQLQSPDEFLPHRLGQTFTPHHLLVDYVKHVAANSPNVTYIEYGRTYEDRPLLLAFVSTPDNLAKLEQIRVNHLRHTGLEPGTPDASLDRSVVWLSFSVHGNEAAGSEASMGVLYDLANPNNAQTQAWLQNTIVVIDPSLNPDGYSRYTHWYRGVANRLPNPHPSSREHREPWPGGRVNHYLFDLNRDWAWQTQVETRQRIPQYRRWMPHVHADLHEQYYENPYYFAPAARPYHRYITDWQGNFQDSIGRNHARYFDANGWLYFTKEVFDLFYPSYGDTYPTFNGAIGMTYEQGGHSRAGRAILLPNTDTLTLYDRVAHHRTTALSTVEIASRRAAELTSNFGDYFRRANTSPTGEYRSYIIKGSNPRGRIRALTQLLDRNGIRYGRAGKNASLRGYDYNQGKEGSVSLAPDDLLISAYQPMSVLTQVLFDPAAELEDSLTYDITAWSLPKAYGLEAYASTTRLETAGAYQLPPYENRLGSAAETAYAYGVKWESMNDARFLAQLLQAGISVRYSSVPFRAGNEEFPRGSLVITRADNRKMDNFADRLGAIVATYEPDIYPLSSGYSSQGPDLGSDAMKLIPAPRVALLSGEATYANEFGQVWYYFEQDLGYPVDVLYDDDPATMNLGDIDVLIYPEGRYRLSAATQEKLSSWVQQGGKLILMGDALNAFADQNAFALKRRNENGNGGNGDEAQAALLQPYGDRERSSISSFIPGAIFKIRLDNTHPLGYGLADTYFSLKTNSLNFPYLEDAWNVGTVGQQPQVAGFVGAQAYESLRESMVFAVEEKGRGQVIYLVDNPLFRGFWENGKFLFSNALFMVQGG